MPTLSSLTMIKSYNLKIYGNKQKLKRLNILLSFWRDQVNHKIAVFWEFESLVGSYPPKEYTGGGRLISDTSKKAWQIVKGAKKTGQKNRPVFTANEIDLNESSAHIITGFGTKEFDIWFSIISTEPRKRLKIPCKRTSVLNQALQEGAMRKSFKLFRKDGGYYISVFVNMPEEEADNDTVTGIDVGLDHAAVTSTGRFYGEDIKPLRIRTRHRVYNRGVSAVKQLLNRVAKEIVSDHPGNDFAVEDLLFKGKRGRTRSFRRRHLNWAYNHLSKKLKQIGIVKGFDVIRVNPKNTSRTCPMCGFISAGNRRGDSFRCLKCGFIGHADHVASVNIAERVPQELAYLQLTNKGGS